MQEHSYNYPVNNKLERWKTEGRVKTAPLSPTLMIRERVRESYNWFLIHTLQHTDPVLKTLCIVPNLVPVRDLGFGIADDSEHRYNIKVCRTDSSHPNLFNPFTR